MILTDVQKVLSLVSKACIYAGFDYRINLKHNFITFSFNDCINVTIDKKMIDNKNVNYNQDRIMFYLNDFVILTLKLPEEEKE